MNNFLKCIIVVIGFLFPAMVQSASKPSIEKGAIVSSIKPIHSLVEAVLGDRGSSLLLIDGASSIHNFQLKPSQQRALGKAQVVFFIDAYAETFLTKAFAASDSKGRLVPLADDPAIQLLAKRHGDDWQHHEHAEHEESDAHEQDEYESESAKLHAAHGRDVDLHIWLDPENAVLMVHNIEAVLSELYPEFSAEFSANAKQFIDELYELDVELKKQMQPLVDKPFIVFHDAFGYFEKRYSLRGVGSILLNTGLAPSVNQIKAVRQTLEETSAVCVFSEPQFSERVVSVVIEEKQVKSGRVDPLGAHIKPGRSLYFKLMQDLASGFQQCLAS